MSTFQQRARTSRQARITEASIAGMATKGCFDFRIEDLAETVGMAKCSSYLRFRSKADLIRASFEELESRVLAEYERRLADLSGEVAALDRLTLISLLNLDSSTGFFSRGVFTRLPCMLENLRREDVTRRVEKLVVSVLADGVSAGLRSGFPPEAQAELFVDNVTSQFFRRPDRGELLLEGNGSAGGNGGVDAAQASASARSKFAGRGACGSRPSGSHRRRQARLRKSPYRFCARWRLVHV